SVDMGALRGYLRRPGLVIAATLWTAIAVPLLFIGGGLLSGADSGMPDLFLGLLLHGATSPMMAAPALAALLGLDATLVLMTLVASAALTPVTAPLFVHYFAGGSLVLSPMDFASKLFLMLAGSAFAAFLVRRLVGVQAILRRRAEIDGINVIGLFVFVAAIMGNVGESFLAMPLLAIGLTLLSFAIFFGVLGITMLVLSWAGAERAFALGFMAAQRNMGLMLAATGGAVPELTWLYFALSQFPIYLTPQLLAPVARRLRARRSGRT
ncbi:MAG: Na+-dependent transporter, partial [Pseudomonadota bacterium]